MLNNQKSSANLEQRNEIQVFNNTQFGEIRVAVNEVGESIFCLADLCRVLDLTAKFVNQRLSDEVVSNHPIHDKLGRKQLALFVNEDGMYDVVLDSRKPEARAFRKWLTSEVLPSIRKTGGYINAAVYENRLIDSKVTFDNLPAAVGQLLNEVNQIKKLLLRPAEPQEHQRFDFIGTLCYLKEQGYHISKSKLQKLTALGDIPCRKFNRRLVFDRAELDVWVQSRTDTVCNSSDTAVLTLAASASRKLKRRRNA